MVSGFRARWRLAKTLTLALPSLRCRAGQRQLTRRETGRLCR